jgi:hypothetical protein
MSTERTTRRGFFNRMISGVHGAALASLLQAETGYDLRPKKPHFEPKAKAVIHLFMNGGPSQVDLFDPSPRSRNSPGPRPAATSSTRSSLPIRSA